jgi:predicted ABC-type ATPase
VKHSKKSPRLYIIAGPNGAGKTTFAKEFLPHYADCYEFVNADLIAGGLSPFQPERAAIQAGKIMLEQIHALSKRGVNFGFETTLSGKTFVHLLRDLKKQGYHIHLFFLWIPDVDLALKRIADRVKNGGHTIPENVVRRRFNKGLQNFCRIYRPLLDTWALFDNSTDTPDLIVYEEFGKLTIFNTVLYSSIMKNLVKK